MKESIEHANSVGKRGGIKLWFKAFVILLIQFSDNNDDVTDDDDDDEQRMGITFGCSVFVEANTLNETFSRQ